MAGNHSAAVLRNKGVSVSVNETEVADGAPRIRLDEAGEPLVQTAWVRFDGNTLADLEDAFGDLGQFQSATSRVPFTTVRRALAIVFGWDDAHPRRADGTLDPSGRDCPGCRRAGLAMQEGGANGYATAMVAALSLANGLDPTRVVKMIEVGVRAETEAKADRMAALDEMLTLEDAVAAPAATPDLTSTSTDGSTHGSPLDAVTTSSGG